MTDQIRPYAIDVPQAQLDDLRDRLSRVRWTEELADTEWDYGMPVGYLQKLVAYWRDEYDWRAWERRLNAHGADGWELDALVRGVALQNEQDGHLLIFRREVP